jgi:hypothetical protein
VIYIKITAQTDTMQTQTIVPSFVTMCDAGSNLCKYFYDGNVVVRKETYNTMFYEYQKLCGASGLYPLNSQLAEVVKNIGEQSSQDKAKPKHFKCLGFALFASASEPEFRTSLATA